ncbi:MAG: hypothetical protein EP335_17905 [Alphaproteobacteria bacterium]|nr:MAG: hypothetical protein EP335_17905 [Alphaproteobacteria bacterium]
MTDENNNRKTASRLHIGNALLWAAAMIAGAILMRESEGWRDYFFLLVILAGTSTAIIGSQAGTCELSLYRRLFRKGDKA